MDARFSLVTLAEEHEDCLDFCHSLRWLFRHSGDEAALSQVESMSRLIAHLERLRSQIIFLPEPQREGLDEKS